MSLVKIVLVFLSLQTTVAAGTVICNPKLATYRARYRNYLRNRGEIFMAVSYSSIREENSTITTDLLKKIEAEFSEIQMPITLVSSGKSSYVCAHFASGAFQQSGFTFLQEYIWKNQIKLESDKVYSYVAVIQEINQTEIVLFNVCHLFVGSKGKLIVEKSVLVLILGRLLERTTDIQEIILKKPFTMRSFELDEFADQDFDICNDLIYYLDECIVKKSEVWIVYFEIAVIVAACSVGIICLTKFSRKIINSNETNQSHSSQIQLDPAVLSVIQEDTIEVKSEEEQEVCEK